LIELLVVISIIAILASLLLPVISAVVTRAKIRDAHTEMQNLAASISQYDSLYSRLPGLTNVDMTFGYGATSLSNTVPVNSDVMVILMDEDVGVNANHARNPNQKELYNPRRNSDMTRAGVSIIDWQLRDPWGNPYVITLDLNYDGKCYDAFYRKQNVSQTSAGSAVGFNGLRNSDSSANSDDFYLKGDVMIWSMGPDGKADPNIPANEGVNKDNVLGWE